MELIEVKPTGKTLHQFNVLVSTGRTELIEKLRELIEDRPTVITVHQLNILLLMELIERDGEAETVKRLTDDLRKDRLEQYLKKVRVRE